MQLDWRRAGAGLVDTLPFVPGVVVLGTTFGVSAGAAGVDSLATIVMSAVVFSGAGQFAALPLWHQHGLVIGLSTLVLSLRFALMTASMAPRLAKFPRWLRAVLAFGVTDENYALAVTRRGGEMEPEYLGGSWLALYLPWVGGTALGVLLGARASAEWTGPLDAVFPTVFLVLTVLCCTTRPAAAVALLAAVLAVVGMLYLPGGWHVVLAGLLASLAGPGLERVLGEEDRA
jgi:4-azaleucine resistance transporter AzlC